MDGLDERKRLTVEERASRRDMLARVQGDRYASLLHALRAGQEIDIRRRRRPPLRWHPIAGTLIRFGIVAVFLYIAVAAGVRFVRERQVDTWIGPPGVVTSGQVLEGCPQVTGYDGIFPRWLRFEGRVYRATGFIRPVGFEENPRYPETGYTLGELHLQRIAGTPSGLAGETVLLRLASVPTGELYEVIPDCR
jgi:hypothetical protein